MVTETGALAHAMDVGRATSGLDGGPLITSMVVEHAQEIERSRQERLAALDELSQFAGYYPDGYLDEVRDGWPE
ncbi:hypothetical protein AB1046_17075 [Promicromonospora sp. Populi]|uniref:hypothetical protein n=1 Tax=Promicromonospora sp. Populi TaxID=3239420 RepID=UPI0034E1998A